LTGTHYLLTPQVWVSLFTPATFRKYREISQRYLAMRALLKPKYIAKSNLLGLWHAPCSMYAAVHWSEKRMLRITESSENGTVRLRLDGTLTAASCAELETACSRHRADSETIVLLDMTGIVFMNDETARRVANLRSQRLRIINCSPFIETLLETVEK
jgi:anti-anti-sigma regulatory factor